MKKLLSVGEATHDSFVFIHDANVHCDINKKNCQLCLGYGEKILADDVVNTVGGNAANTAVSFARLGHESQLFSMVGDDSMGREIVNQLKKDKVDDRYIQIEKGKTSSATGVVFKGERVQMIHHIPRDYNLPNFEPVDWVYLTSMGKAYAHAYERVITFVKKHNIKVSFNPGTFQLKAGVNALKPILAVTQILFVNVEEARHLTELSSKAEIIKLAEGLYDLGPKIVVITDGPAGAYAFDGEKLLFCDIFDVEIIERTGCGDSFGAGFTAAILEGKTISEALRWGMANSMGVVQKVGPQEGLLTKSEMEEALNDFHKIQPKLVK